MNRLYREFLPIHSKIKPKQNVSLDKFHWLSASDVTSLVEHVFGQNLSKPLIIGSASVGSFSMNCTTQ